LHYNFRYGKRPSLIRHICEDNQRSREEP
jgi:hypothetical protein